MIGLEVGVVHESHDYDDHSLTWPTDLDLWIWFVVVVVTSKRFQWVDINTTTSAKTIIASI